MAGIQKRRASNAKNKGVHRARKAKHYSRHHDQIHEDLKQPGKFQNMDVDETKPGSGQHYCISCARYFESLETLKVQLNDQARHQTTKRHRRMHKEMLTKPYSHEEAYNAGK